MPGSAAILCTPLPPPVAYPHRSGSECSAGIEVDRHKAVTAPNKPMIPTTRTTSRDGPSKNRMPL
jgi:hypothetical protein